MATAQGISPAFAAGQRVLVLYGSSSRVLGWLIAVVINGRENLAHSATRLPLRSEVRHHTDPLRAQAHSGISDSL